MFFRRNEECARRSTVSSALFRSVVCSHSALFSTQTTHQPLKSVTIYFEWKVCAANQRVLSIVDCLGSIYLLFRRCTKQMRDIRWKTSDEKQQQPISVKFMYFQTLYKYENCLLASDRRDFASFSSRVSMVIAIPREEQNELTRNNANNHRNEYGWGTFPRKFRRNREVSNDHIVGGNPYLRKLSEQKIYYIFFQLPFEVVRATSNWITSRKLEVSTIKSLQIDFVRPPVTIIQFTRSKWYSPWVKRCLMNFISMENKQKIAVTSRSNCSCCSIDFEHSQIVPQQQCKWLASKASAFRFDRSQGVEKVWKFSLFGVILCVRPAYDELEHRRTSATGTENGKWSTIKT